METPVREETTKQKVQKNVAPQKDTSVESPRVGSAEIEKARRSREARIAAVRAKIQDHVSLPRRTARFVKKAISTVTHARIPTIAEMKHALKSDAARAAIALVVGSSDDAIIAHQQIHPVAGHERKVDEFIPPKDIEIINTQDKHIAAGGEPPKKNDELQPKIVAGASHTDSIPGGQRAAVKGIIGPTTEEAARFNKMKSPIAKH